MRPLTIPRSSDAAPMRADITATRQQLGERLETLRTRLQPHQLASRARQTARQTLLRHPVLIIGLTIGVAAYLARGRRAARGRRTAHSDLPGVGLGLLVLGVGVLTGARLPLSDGESDAWKHAKRLLRHAWNATRVN